jgi:DNA gyrase/topoisomerase IV subunit A
MNTMDYFQVWTDENGKVNNIKDDGPSLVAPRNPFISAFYPIFSIIKGIYEGTKTEKEELKKELNERFGRSTGELAKELLELHLKSLEESAEESEEIKKRYEKLESEIGKIKSYIRDLYGELTIHDESINYILDSLTKFAHRPDPSKLPHGHRSNIGGIDFDPAYR